MLLFLLYLQMHKDIFVKEQMHKMDLAVHNFKIEERRRKVASLLAQSITESEIAQELNVINLQLAEILKHLKSCLSSSYMT